MPNQPDDPRATASAPSVPSRSPEWMAAVASFADIVDEERRDPGLVRGVQVRPEHDCWDRCAWDKPTCKPHTGGWHGIGSRRIFWYVAVPGRGVR